MGIESGGPGRELSVPNRDSRESLPTDRKVDRRGFLQRMTAITAAVSAGTAVYPITPLPGSGTAAGAVSAPRAPGSRRKRPSGSRDPFRRPLPLPEASRISLNDPVALSLAELASLIEAGRLSPVELVEAYLARIDAHDSVYRAFKLVLADEALADAEELARASWRGPLHGIPLAVKDNFYTAGVPTLANSHIFEDFVPDFDATAVSRLQGAGAILLGKTEMGPLATSRATTPDGDWTTLNAWAPHIPEVSPGGSSSGSATSVASRMAASSIGTQTGGSINNPSLALGLTGLKPTMGRASVYGVIPLTYTRDHPGPLARDALDAAIIMQAIAGPDPSDPRTLGLPEVSDLVEAATPIRTNGRPAVRWPTTLGVLPGYLDLEVSGAGDEDTEEERVARRGRSEAEVNARKEMLRVFEELGVRVVEVNLPEDWEILSGRLFNNVRLPERSEPFLEVLREDVRKFGVSLAPWINGLLLDGTEYLRGQRAKLLLLERVLDQFFGHCDVVVQTDAYRFDIIGLPLINFPIGFEEASTGYPRPLGAMLGGMPYAEDRLLSLAAAYQEVTDWHRRRPAEPETFVVDGREARRPRINLREVMEVGE